MLWPGPTPTQTTPSARPGSRTRGPARPPFCRAQGRVRRGALAPHCTVASADWGHVSKKTNETDQCKSDEMRGRGGTGEGDTQMNRGAAVGSGRWTAAQGRRLHQGPHRVSKQGTSEWAARTFHRWAGRAAELRELLPQHGPQLLVQFRVVEQGSQMPGGVRTRVDVRAPHSEPDSTRRGTSQSAAGPGGGEGTRAPRGRRQPSSHRGRGLDKADPRRGRPPAPGHRQSLRQDALLHDVVEGGEDAVPHVGLQRWGEVGDDLEGRGSRGRSATVPLKEGLTRCSGWHRGPWGCGHRKDGSAPAQATDTGTHWPAVPHGDSIPGPVVTRG